MTNETTPTPMDFTNVSFTPEQTLSVYQDLLKYSTEPDKIITAVKADGIDLVAQPVARPVTAEQQFVDFVAPAASPAEYQIHYDDARTVTPQVDAELRENFHLAGVPASQADGLANALLDSAKRYPDTLTEPRRVLAMRHEGTRIRALSHADEIVRLAHIGANSLPPAFIDRMYASRSLHTAEAWGQLAALGGALEARGKSQ